MYFTTLFIAFRNIYVVIINMEMDTANVEELKSHFKTSLKMHYDAQTAVIERQLGGLESVRSKLGLSQRKMAQLLMVDPSAWTRWNRPGIKAPGVVWRALQWYMILNEKVPGLTPNYFLGPSSDVLSERLSKFEQKIGDLERKLKLWRIGTLIMTATLIFSVFVWILWARRGYF
jgi:hypothetical protein